MDSNLKSFFPTLYLLAIDKESNVTAFLSKIIIEENFRQPLPRQGLSEISELKTLLHNISLTNSQDRQIWKWLPKNCFTVLSCYKFLKHGGITSQFGKAILGLPIPEKWLGFNNKLLTAEVSAKKGFIGPSQCTTLCYLEEETTDHLFLNCCFSKIVWHSIMQCCNSIFIPETLIELWTGCRNTHRITKHHMSSDTLIAIVCWTLWKE